MNLEPKIIAEDNHYVVISKPAGLLSQGDSSQEDSLVTFFQKLWGRPYVGLVHRLDRNTSGIMVVAKRSKAAQRLTDALQNDEIKRTYLAWVEGTPPHALTLKHYLKKNESNNVVTVHERPTPGAKEALLSAKKIRTGVIDGTPITLLEIRLETGRSHQIRAQLSHEGYPIAGDQKYGALTRLSGRSPRPALHSWKISFPHPTTKEILNFEDPLPKDLEF